MIDREHIEAQIALIDLVGAMYPDQVCISPEDIAIIEQLRNWVDKSDATMPAKASSKIYLRVRLLMNGESSKTIELNVSIDFNKDEASDTSAVAYNIRQPEWLSRVQITELSSALPKDDLIDALNFLAIEGADHIRVPRVKTPPVEQSSDTLVRVWFYFPSISTREKRDDIVKHAPSYSLTGFLLAGKPGMLCLEGSSHCIDDYMKFIKTHSWSDIPSHQKKVSERLRENDVAERIFADMEEITDAPFMGAKSGLRGNRTDMQTLEAWLHTKGLRDAFSKTIF